MSNHKRKTVDWLLRGEMAAVFVVMSWALLWASTRWRRPAPSWRPSGCAWTGVALVATGPGHQLDSNDPDGAAFLERSRRRRHID